MMSSASKRKRKRKDKYLDKKWDWRNFGVLKHDPPKQIKGTCWAHVVVGAVEANMQVRMKPSLQLSVQELIDCCFVEGGINEGSVGSALKHIKSRGVTTSTLYPTSLSPEGGLCKRCHEKLPPRVRISGYTVIEDVTVGNLMEAVKKTPVIVSFLANDLFDSYKKEDNVFEGSYPLDKIVKGVGGHGVLIVGYDTEKGGVGEPSQGYWIVRNSYGKEWGDNGYMKMHRDLTCYFDYAVYPEGAGLVA